MLFDSLSFKAVESSLSALSIKQQVIVQNLSNQETPDYKQKEVSFENLLADAMDDDYNDSRQEYDFEVTVIEDTTSEINVDGNNVDSDEQSLELYSTYLQHAALVNKINGTFNNFRTVASTNFG